MSWILDPDLKSFFDNISHEKLVQLVEKRIADPRVLRLIQKWLKAGVMEDVWSETEAGTPQGAVVSPLLSNVYLHYVLDQWRQTARGRDYHRALRRRCHSFERQHEPESYLKELKERLREYGLELNEDKTRLIRFGRFARLNRAERREGKPETFTFLGFHHIWGTTGWAGSKSGFRDQVARLWYRTLASAVNGVPLGRSWVRSSTTGSLPVL